MKRLFSLCLILSLLVITVNNFNNDSLLVYLDKLNVINYLNDNGYECIYLNSAYDEVVNSLNMEVVNKIDTGNGFVVEGYVSVLNKYIDSNYNKINIQMSVYDDVVVVGYPLIKNSF